MTSASRTISDLVRLDAVAIASSRENSGCESFTVIVGIQYGITHFVQSNTSFQYTVKVEPLARQDAAQYTAVCAYHH